MHGGGEACRVSSDPDPSRAPRARAPETAAGAGIAREDGAAPSTVLLVDDEPDVLRSLGELLMGLGARVDAAPSMASALALLRGRGYDLVIADERLRDGSGTELLEWVGARTPTTSLVLISAHQDFEMLAQALNRARIHHFFLKPWDPDELLGRVRELLEEQRVLARRLRSMARASVAAEPREPAPTGREGWPPS